MSELDGEEKSYQESKRRVRDLADNIAEYSEANRREFGEALDQHLAALHGKVRHLEECADDLEGTEAVQLKQIARQFKAKLQMFAVKMSATQALTGEAWLELKRGLIQAWRDLTLSIENEAQKYQQVCSDE